MTYHTPKTWVYGEKVDEQDLNEQIRDNMNEVWKFDAPGQMMYSTGGSSSAKLNAGTNGQILMVTSGSPAWKPMVSSRKGSSSTQWASAGTTTYTPTVSKTLVGSSYATVLNGQNGVSGSIAFPENFAGTPIVVCTADGQESGGLRAGVTTYGIGIGSFSFSLFLSDSTAAIDTQFRIHWIAIGL